MKITDSLIIHVMIIFVMLLSHDLYAQKASFPIGPVLNLKAGYHFADNKTEGYANTGDYTIPGGIIFELSGELPTGKGWYPGFSFEYSTGNDAVRDIYLEGLITRNIYITNYQVTLKKRFYMERSAFYLQTGLGKGTVRSEYDRSLGEREDGVISFSFKTGFEYTIGYRTFVSLECSYLGMGQVKFEGTGRGNSLFMLKAGLGYVFK